MIESYGKKRPAHEIFEERGMLRPATHNVQRPLDLGVREHTAHRAFSTSGFRLKAERMRMMLLMLLMMIYVDGDDDDDDDDDDDVDVVVDGDATM